MSLGTNLALLGFFKYFNFGLDSYDSIVSWLGLSDLRLDVALRVTLPLGISFYTFEAMSYAIDVYRGDAKAIRNFIDYSCYVSMFPQLVAGPIVRFSEISDQLLHRTHTATKFARGIAFFSLGPGEEGPARQPVRQDRGPRVRRRIAVADRGVVRRDARTRFRSTSTSAPTPTWPSASA